MVTYDPLTIPQGGVEGWGGRGGGLRQGDYSKSSGSLLKPYTTLSEGLNGGVALTVDGYMFGHLARADGEPH